MSHEATVQADIRAEAGRMGIHLWRNNVGACNDETGRVIRYGLGNDSPQVQRRLKSSDLIGIHSHSPRVSQFPNGGFIAVECKAPGWKFPEAWRDKQPHKIDADTLGEAHKRTLAQWRFLTIVHGSGGLAGFAQSVDDFQRILKGELVLP